MEKNMFFYTLPRSGHHFKGNATSLNHLMALFMTYCEKLGIECDEAISLWFYGSFDSNSREDKLPAGFAMKSWEQIKLLAEGAVKKLPERKEECIDLSDIQS